MKKRAPILFAVIIVGIAAVLLLTNKVEHVEDTNGPDNYALQTITEQDVIDMKMGSRGGVSTSGTGVEFEGVSINKGIKYSSKKFTGVYQLYSAYYFKGSDITLDMVNFEVKEGNFKFYVVFEDRILDTIEPDALVTYRYDNLEKSGTVRFVIAGESANFKFTTQDFEE